MNKKKRRVYSSFFNRINKKLFWFCFASYSIVILINIINNLNRF